MAILTDLPNELVRKVVRGSEQKDLVGFGRISARFREESQAELFYFPILDARNAARFLASLESNIELPKLVKKLEIQNIYNSISAETLPKLLCLVTELMTLKCSHLKFHCRWLVFLPKLHSFSLVCGHFIGRRTEPSSFPSIKNLYLHCIECQNVQSTLPFPLLFPSVTTLYIYCHPHPMFQPFGQHTKYLYLCLDNVDQESIKLLANLESFHSLLPLRVLCDVLTLLPSSMKHVRIGRYGSAEDWSILVKLFESNLESFQQLETVYIESYAGALPGVVELRNVLEKREIRLEVLDGYDSFEDWIKLVTRSDRNRLE